MIDPIEFQALAKTISADISVAGATRLIAYLEAMLLQNHSVNLTAIRDPEAAVMFHALDSVALACGGFDKSPSIALDLGTGNGFPGVAIACVFPKARIVLMDRTLKKLKAVDRALDAAGFEAGRFKLVQMDAAEAPAHGYKSHFDLITARAVGPPSEMGRLAKPLLVRGGRLLTWLSDATESPPALKGGLRRCGQVEYTLPPPASRFRRLVHFQR